MESIKEEIKFKELQEKTLEYNTINESGVYFGRHRILNDIKNLVLPHLQFIQEKTNFYLSAIPERKKKQRQHTYEEGLSASDAIEHEQEEIEKGKELGEKYSKGFIIDEETGEAKPLE